MIYLLKDSSGDYKVGTSDYSLEVLDTREGDEECASILSDYLRGFLRGIDSDIDLDYLESELVRRFHDYTIVTNSDIQGILVFEMGEDEARKFLSDNPLFYDYLRSRIGKVEF